MSKQHFDSFKKQYFDRNVVSSKKTNVTFCLMLRAMSDVTPC